MPGNEKQYTVIGENKSETYASNGISKNYALNTLLPGVQVQLFFLYLDPNDYMVEEKTDEGKITKSQITYENDFDFDFSTFSINKKINLTSTIPGNEKEISYEFDGKDRLTKVSLKGTSTITISYGKSPLQFPNFIKNLEESEG